MASWKVHDLMWAVGCLIIFHNLLLFSPTKIPSIAGIERNLIQLIDTEFYDLFSSRNCHVTNRSECDAASECISKSMITDASW